RRHPRRDLFSVPRNQRCCPAIWLPWKTHMAEPSHCFRTPAKCGKCQGRNSPWDTSWTAIFGGRPAGRLRRSLLTGIIVQGKQESNQRGNAFASSLIADVVVMADALDVDCRNRYAVRASGDWVDRFGIGRDDLFPLRLQ